MIRKPKLLAAAFTLFLALAPGATHADLQNEIDGLFGSMSNVTAAGRWETQRRGGFTGGELTVKNHISNENLISFVPPSFEAGCGGIDLFGGSFSFISAEQFVQLLRNIAANAAGYAFKLALGAMCPDCAAILEQLQKAIQQLNQMFSNSCKAAKFLVDKALEAPLESMRQKGALISLGEGWGDLFQTNTTTTGVDPLSQAQQANPDRYGKVITGNLVWRALKAQTVSGWFQYGDTALLEAMMNITGTVIIGEQEDSDDGKGKAPRIIPVSGNRLTFADIIHGNMGSAAVNTLKCDTHGEDGCKNPSPGAITIRGFEPLVRRKLIDGENGSPGLVSRIAANSGSLTAADKAFLSPQRFQLAAMIVRLARYGSGLAETYADAAAPHIAYELAYVVVEDLFRAVQSAAGVQDHAFVQQLLEHIKEARANLRNEYLKEQQKIGNPHDLYMKFYYLSQAAEKKPLALPKPSSVR